MYDEEKCLRSGAFKSLLAGEQGKLPILTRGLRRNDAEVSERIVFEIGAFDILQEICWEAFPNSCIYTWGCVFSVADSSRSLQARSVGPR